MENKSVLFWGKKTLNFERTPERGWSMFGLQRQRQELLTSALEVYCLWEQSLVSVIVEMYSWDSVLFELTIFEGIGLPLIVWLSEIY